ncbi:MAG: hypothetical protein K2J79_07570, partial [Ruminiclostridium sp.]|nr:hypothetical protein [Ruminiclostridium sp.]
DRLYSVMMQAKNNKIILEFILKTANVPEEQKNTFLKNYIDELIESPNKAEKKVYEEIAYNELVIRLEGDVERAQKQYEAERTKKAADLNLIAEMIDWIYERDSEEVNGQIRLSMFTLTKSLQEKAAEVHAEEYRARRKSSYSVTVGDYSTVADFKREDEEHKKIGAYYNEKKNSELSAIKAWPAFIGFGLGALALAGSFFVGYWLLALTLGGVGFGVFKLLSNRSMKKQIIQKYDESIRITDETMTRLFEEFGRYSRELDEYDAYYEQIKDAFAKI